MHAKMKVTDLIKLENASTHRGFYMKLSFAIAEADLNILNELHPEWRYRPEVQHPWLIYKFRILPRDFSIEGGELSTSGRVKRKAIEEKYKDQI